MLMQKKCFTSPLYITERLNEQLADLDRRITSSVQTTLKYNMQSLSAISARLAALNPMNVLARGYSAVFDDNGKVVSEVKKLKKDDKLTLVMSDGKTDVKVI